METEQSERDEQESFGWALPPAGLIVHMGMPSVLGAHCPACGHTVQTAALHPKAAVSESLKRRASVFAVELEDLLSRAVHVNAPQGVAATAISLLYNLTDELDRRMKMTPEKKSHWLKLLFRRRKNHDDPWPLNKLRSANRRGLIGDQMTIWAEAGMRDGLNKHSAKTKKPGEARDLVLFVRMLAEEMYAGPEQT